MYIFFSVIYSLAADVDGTWQIKKLRSLQPHRESVKSLITVNRMHQHDIYEYLY